MIKKYLILSVVICVFFPSALLKSQDNFYGVCWG